jgi:hypothetical protein
MNLRKVDRERQTRDEITFANTTTDRSDGAGGGGSKPAGSKDLQPAA